MFNTKKINDCSVKMQSGIQVDNGEDCRGSDLFKKRYSNIYLCAKKQSGKTSTLSYIVRKTVQKNTCVIIFSSTAQKDPVMMRLVETLKNKGIAVVTHLSMISDDGDNMLQEFSDYMEGKAKQENEEFEEYSDDEEIPTIDGIKDYIIVLDDLSLELKNKHVDNFLKRNRHFKCKVILSSQHFNDLSLQARLQIDYLLVFGNLPRKKIDEIVSNFDINIDSEKFHAIYKFATKDKFSFLYCDIRSSQYRKNFNEMIDVSHKLDPAIPSDSAE